jgi:hypothetical protein
MLDSTKCWIRHPIAAIAEAVGDIPFTVCRNTLKPGFCCDR